MPGISSSTTRFLPHAVVATLAVIVLPAVAVSFLGAMGSAWHVVASLLLAMAVSVGAASLGSAIWARQPGSRDMVFADLMLWGWLRRVRAERRLAEARGLLGTRAGGNDPGELSRERRCQVLQELATELEAKDLYTLGHSRRVTRHCERIARELGLSGDDVARIRIAASLHDVGKARTPRTVLTKPGPLSDEEFTLVKRHVDDGADMVAVLGDPEVAAMVRHHHERLDGSGYPDGLRGDDIPLGARIIAVADTFDAMTSNRPYQRAYKHRQALEVLSAEAGIRLDPDAVEAFLRYYSGTKGIALSAVGFAAHPRLAGWAGGALSGVGGSAAPIPHSIAAILATALAGLGFGGPAAPDTAASERKSTRASQASEPDRRDSPFGSPAAGGPGALAIGRGEAVSGGGRLDRPPDRPGEQPSAPVVEVLDPIAEPPRIPAVDRPPVVQVPEAELPRVETPPVRLPAVEVPRLETPVIELPGVEVPGVEVPRVELPGVGLPQVELPRVALPQVEQSAPRLRGVRLPETPLSQPGP